MRKIVTTLLFLLAWTSFAFGDQSPLSSPTVGTVSGLQLTNNYNSALNAVNTCNSGTTAPTNQLSGVPSAGNCWYNTTTGQVQWYDGTNWLTVGFIDTTNHLWRPVTGGGIDSVASAATTNLCGSAGAAPTSTIETITGTTTITSFGSNCTTGQLKVLQFSGILTLTNGANIVIPGGANITTAANDVTVLWYAGGGVWKLQSYQGSNGSTPGNASLVAADQVLSGGATVTAFNNGTESSGTFTPDCGKNPLQYFTNGGAFTLAAPSNDSACDLLDTNNASAGTITFSGFTVGSNTGDSLTNTNTSKFIIHIERINGTATYLIKALQ